MVKKFLTLALFVSTSLLSATHGEKTISKVWVNSSSGVYFAIHQPMVDVEGCGSNTLHHVMRGAEYEKEMFSVLLTAKASGSKVTFSISGCDSGFPRVTWISVEE